MHLLTHSIILKALGWWLFNSLWQMGLLWLVYTLFTFTFRRASANARHGLALLLLAAGAGWSALSFIGYFTFGALTDGSFDRLLPASGLSFYNILSGGHRIIGEILPYCATLYLVTLFLLVIRYANQYFHARRLRQKGLSRVAPELRLFTAETARQMGINKKVGIWLSTLVEAPVTLGLIRPLILLPVATATHLTTAQLEAILLHELAHIRGNDYLLNLGISAMEVIFFFNPFARLLIRGIKKEREHRCDDVVIQFRYDAHEYASALLSLATRIQGQPQLMLAATGSNDQFLLQRVRRILKVKSTRERQTGRSLLFLLFPLMAALLALNFSQQPASAIADVTVNATVPALQAIARPLFSESSSTDGATTENPEDSASQVQPTDGTQTTSDSTSATPATEEAPTADPAPPVARIQHPIMIFANDQPDDAAENNIVLTSQQADQADQNTASADGYDYGYIEDAKTVTTGSSRDYSIAMTVTPINKTLRDLQRQKVASGSGRSVSVYVPNTSFLYRTVYDTSSPDPRYIYLQKKAVKEMQTTMVKMQKDLQLQLKIMAAAQASENREVMNEQKQILSDQIKLQQRYLEQQRALQLKLEKAVSKRVIVVI